MSRQDKKPGSIFYIIALIAFLISLTGFGAVIGIPLLGAICRYAFREGQNRD